MKRYISYLYLYENSSCIKNVGFVKITEFSSISKLELHIQGLGNFFGRLPLYFLSLSKTNSLCKTKIQEVEIKKGYGRLFLEVPLEKIYGAAGLALCGVLSSGQTFHISCIWSEEKSISISPDFLTETPQDYEADTDTASIPSRPEAIWTKIDITEIQNLPKEHWYLCNNSFLLHGFFNYRHLMIKETPTKKYLGVPGIFELPEKMMATLFGFPDFETEHQKLERAGTFGYWLKELR